MKDRRYKWKDHIERMGNERLPKLTVKYKPTEGRNIGRPILEWSNT